MSTPPNADSAFEELDGLVCCLYVYTTSAAVSGAPLWNLTPWRILNVQTSAVEFADQLSASTGDRFRVWPDRVRYSPVCASMSSPPWSATVIGLIAAVGVVMPARITAPGAPAAELDAEADDEPDEPDDDAELPQAARIDPSTGTEMPTTVARRMKSRRDNRPAANSSMMWLAISPWPWRKRPSRRWSMLRVTRSLPDAGRIHLAGWFAVQKAGCGSGSGDRAPPRGAAARWIRRCRSSAGAGTGCGTRSRSADRPPTGSRRSAGCGTGARRRATVRPRTAPRCTGGAVRRTRSRTARPPSRA